MCLCATTNITPPKLALQDRGYECIKINCNATKLINSNHILNLQLWKIKIKSNTCYTCNRGNKSKQINFYRSITSRTYYIRQNVTDEQFDKLFPVIDGARFSGATATASSLAPDDNTPFEISLPELITVSHRVQKLP